MSKPINLISLQILPNKLLNGLVKLSLVLKNRKQAPVQLTAEQGVNLNLPILPVM